jgi:hypothetical protein
LSPKEKAKIIADKKKKAEKKKKEKAKQKYQEWIENQFSLWDGSNTYLVDLVKENMNNPDSFKHVETRYVDKGQGKGIVVYMKYRGTNAFGGVVTNYVEAFCDYKNNTITITATE